MDKAATDKRGIVYRVLTLISVCLIAASFFSPGWWVSLTAPNYPEATFPQGIRILFHMDSVRNGCDIRDSTEVEENEALDCVHEMDTINHYVGMYPIASGGPVEKAYSPFLFGMMGVMLLAFAAPGRNARIAVSVVGYGAVAAWMTLAMHGENGISKHTTAYLEGLVVSLGQDSGEKVDDSNLSPIVKMLKQSLEESEAKETPVVAGTGDKQALIDNLRANYNIDNNKKPTDQQEAWSGSVMQVFEWHYAKSLARWFNEPERNDPLVATMSSVAQVLYVVILAFMALMVFAAFSARSVFYWLLVLVPMALPVGFLAEYAGWLWWYGHSLNEMGAFTLKPFMPTVFGDGKVAQFTTHSYPSTGFFLMLASSAVLLLAALIRFKQIRLAGDAAAKM
ncbi:hypothetical protein OE699_14450 [Sedimentimonas flavescens]|uniref:Uncharacterized protein n=1 Tax=Sedimentimonas flavescens TaxID=2851012 RepID=A0ABT3A272_9RHOB|nr:hypothetical protein [Sedimentimonas flavescens]MBW0157058.1 hypothetical protein [Sedimentimonas flavescens]MCT2539550.1 hypothetical protein [Sedimentimonas flavescens]MCV2880048.1 hypothetical protein [Sedimentimonas flavescens]WBL32805.1 hypothetical protein O5O51_13930 [Sinirhodobacter sp. HNIBRBA609]